MEHKKDENENSLLFGVLCILGLGLWMLSGAAAIAAPLYLLWQGARYLYQTRQDAK